MNVNILIALFAVVTLLQLYHCKPTHRFVRETKDEDEGRTKGIKEFLSQFYGGFTSQSQSPSPETGSTSPHQPGWSTPNQSQSSSPYQPGSSTPNQSQSSSPCQPGSSTPYQPGSLISPLEETQSGPEVD